MAAQVEVIRPVYVWQKGGLGGGSVVGDWEGGQNLIERLPEGAGYSGIF